MEKTGLIKRIERSCLDFFYCRWSDVIMLIKPFSKDLNMISMVNCHFHDNWFLGVRKIWPWNDYSLLCREFMGPLYYNLHHFIGFSTFVYSDQLFTLHLTTVDFEPISIYPNGYTGCIENEINHYIRLHYWKIKCNKHAKSKPPCRCLHFFLWWATPQPNTKADICKPDGRNIRVCWKDFFYEI